MQTPCQERSEAITPINISKFRGFGGGLCRAANYGRAFIGFGDVPCSEHRAPRTSDTSARGSRHISLNYPVFSTTMGRRAQRAPGFIRVKIVYTACGPVAPLVGSFRRIVKGLRAKMPDCTDLRHLSNGSVTVGITGAVASTRRIGSVSQIGQIIP